MGNPGVPFRMPKKCDVAVVSTCSWNQTATFTGMLDRVHERLFGYCLPYSLTCSLNPEGLRVLGTLPTGYSGFGPLDATPMWYVPVPVLPMILPLEFRTDLAECGWQQAPYFCLFWNQCVR